MLFLTDNSAKQNASQQLEKINKKTVDAKLQLSCQVIMQYYGCSG